MPTNLIAVESVAQRILLIRGQKVMLDADLAELFGVPTKVFNQAIKFELQTPSSSPLSGGEPATSPAPSLIREGWGGLWRPGGVWGVTRNNLARCFIIRGGILAMPVTVMGKWRQ